LLALAAPLWIFS